MVIFSKSPEETYKIAEALSRHVRPGDVICLQGDLGAGKTHFAQGFARGLGIEEHVTSPTFTLINEYTGRLPFYHIDAYRLEDPDEGYELGLEEYFYGSGVTLIEWPSKIKELLPEAYLEIAIEKETADEYRRKLTFRARGERYSNLMQELKTGCMC
ncbi:hypothetical protein Tfer_1498 [Thermincola ferriacetica]|uniref:tRNA threonylcarbamoyladenosine biosynthesis protein TsaE n=2 Tax=Thermincola TaxID=278993 RepID=D5XCG9_THEPJ|nr:MULTISPECIES: tRNA (adenosine(37)-N6)-threonylcarbamoyltransferase complex ATPase subunit type 1 TsaE [Thermincola]ADG81595.1 protein of unknown function UPF0079 [Thermincola potens JR]KNZ69887.1 hypothetical protein Tfer_1498 [Thermincola ferriacetica]